MTNEGDFRFGLLMGLVLAALFAVALWHGGESRCQQLHNVADCEYARTPFLPTPPTDEKE